MHSANTKEAIERRLFERLSAVARERESLTDRVSLAAYSSLVRRDGEGEIWTDALQTALNEHEIVVIPPRDEPYFIDSTVFLPSDRRLEAFGATLQLTQTCDLAMFMTHSAADGSHAPIDHTKHPRARNISIFGGRFEEQHTAPAGYGKSGKSDKERSLYGVSAMFYLGNIEGLTVSDATFVHAGGFSVQLGDADGALFENLRFENGFADGLHINGNTRNVYAHRISGSVGDDLVALNAYDWQRSSVNYGPIETVLCEDLEVFADSAYHALRILPGVYWYDNGKRQECTVKNVIFRRVTGVRTVKVYYQTPPYDLGTPPKKGSVGRADELYFEDMDFDLSEPVDKLAEYTDSDPLRGAFGAFEFGENIGRVRLENIRLRLYRSKLPYSYLVCCGPKSARIGNAEIFDPYLSNTVEALELAHISVNGQALTDEKAAETLVKTVSFDDVNRDGCSTGCGKIETVCFEA